MPRFIKLSHQHVNPDHIVSVGPYNDEYSKIFGTRSRTASRKAYFKSAIYLVDGRKLADTKTVEEVIRGINRLLSEEQPKES